MDRKKNFENNFLNFFFFFFEVRSCDACVKQTLDFSEMEEHHRYRKMKNRLLKFCYVPATSTARNRLLFFYFDHHRHLSNIDRLSFLVCPLLAPLIIGFFSFFFAAAIYSTNEANKTGSTRR